MHRCQPRRVCPHGYEVMSHTILTGHEPHRVSTSLLGPVDPSFRALSGCLKPPPISFNPHISSTLTSLSHSHFFAPHISPNPHISSTITSLQLPNLFNPHIPKAVSFKLYISAPSTLHFPPSTLHPPPYNLHPTPYTLPLHSPPSTPPHPSTSSHRMF